MVVHRHDKNWVIPFLFWLAIMLRLLFFHVPITIVTKPMHFVWNNTGVRFGSYIPERMRIPAGAALTIAVIIVGAFASEESQDNTRSNRAVSLFGLVVFLGFFYATSRNRSKIVWHTVIVGMLCQFIIALFVLRTKAGYDIFNFVSTLARELLGFANAGVIFLTGKFLLWSAVRMTVTDIKQMTLFQSCRGSSLVLFHLSFSSSHSCNSCTIGGSFNGSLESLPSSSSGLCVYPVPRLWSLQLLLSSAKENRQC